MIYNCMYVFKPQMWLKNLLDNKKKKIKSL